MSSPKNLSKMSSKALRVMSAKAKSPNVRKNALAILNNRANKAIRVAQQHERYTRWTRGSKTASRKFRSTLDEILPVLQQYRRREMLLNAFHRGAPLTREQRINIVYGPGAPVTYPESNMVRKLLTIYYGRKPENRRYMSNKNWAALFSTLTHRNASRFPMHPTNNTYRRLFIAQN